MAQGELLLDAKAALGEGPCWDERSQIVYWVNIEGRTVNLYNPSSGENREVPVGQRVGAVVPRSSGGAVVVLEDGFYGLDPENGELSFIGNPEGRKPNTRFNDGKCDAAGRFWAGTMSLDGTPKQGALYCLETDGTIRTVLENISCSNGLGWSPDNRTMYYIDSPTRQVIAYDYDLDTGSISNARVAIEVTEEGAVPDGMTCDAEGMIWVALWGGYGVRRWNPHTGELLLKVDVAAEQSSSCAFAGPEWTDLYITSARIGITEDKLAEYPLNGGVFILRGAGKGQPTYSYGG